jgi:NAD(P)-dependent dehydrogenase (short-subunit alcohol dehydrogenase family)
VILTSRNEIAGNEACEGLRAEGLGVLYHQLDVTDHGSVDSLADAINEVYGRCDILVNNAGIFPDAIGGGVGEWPSVFETSLETMRQAMETNVYGPMVLCQELVPLMRQADYGRIVNISSGMGQLSQMNGCCPAYRHSKTALNALTRIMADELKDTNIKVNSMCPGWVKTDMGGSGATREIPEGADTAVWLATLPEDGPSGGFFRDRQPMAW